MPCPAAARSPPASALVTQAAAPSHTTTVQSVTPQCDHSATRGAACACSQLPDGAAVLRRSRIVMYSKLSSCIVVKQRRTARRPTAAEARVPQLQLRIPASGDEEPPLWQPLQAPHRRAVLTHPVRAAAGEVVPAAIHKAAVSQLIWPLTGLFMTANTCTSYHVASRRERLIEKHRAQQLSRLQHSFGSGAPLDAALQARRKCCGVVLKGGVQHRLRLRVRGPQLLPVGVVQPHRLHVSGPAHLMSACRATGMNKLIDIFYKRSTARRRLRLSSK